MADPASVPSPLRVMMFLDFWNFQLGMREVEDKWRADYKKLPWALLAAAKDMLQSPAGVSLAGLKVYGSYDPASQTEVGLHRWATTVLPRFPGVSTEFAERQKKKSGAKCPGCHFEVRTCPSCGHSMLGTGEKGVDTRIATDMVSKAWEGAYDVAVLISSDRDFVPVCSFLQAKGIIVIHGSIGYSGAVVSAACWGQIDLLAIKEEFRLPYQPPAAVV